MKVLVTGSDGFIGKNLLVKLAENSIDFACFTRRHSADDLVELLQDIDFVFHLAGVNRPQDPTDFNTQNHGLTSKLCEAIRDSGRAIPVTYTSSIKAGSDNPYGKSKRAAEEELIGLNAMTQSPVYLYRLPNVFGKWARPNYNSVVATFCNSISQNMPIRIDDAGKMVPLLYIDDLLESFMDIFNNPQSGVVRPMVKPEYSISVGDLANQIEAFHRSRDVLMTEEVGNGLTRALYATYLSYLKPEQFSYEVPAYEDSRGRFVEMLKTKDSGQFSFFTAHPGITRGGHYHHTKSEKFLVLQGLARFGFRNIVTNEVYELSVDAVAPLIVETIPGWTHDITNIGENELIVMLWASEAFDRARPDTIANKV
ncbi:capsular biosynthesis protein [Polynucleobacter paneuropaeus]|uniref:UDP-2-acetamido-2,6-beta-L-arabino-hexul-4-ose reductase n=1 Tax=Polynucleobacter paneuropaeus TaxID=2527775 RepID=UPI000DBF2385|nr:NAD-dependent epimerase/dehydratase family protein [Polynucleobacter paneuropaeus]AWW45646.1 capsular biosynthesis protein [Polynucleobacter paneuropaeus]